METLLYLAPLLKCALSPPADVTPATPTSQHYCTQHQTFWATCIKAAADDPPGQGSPKAARAAVLN